jgi:hypothetical protein
LKAAFVHSQRPVVLAAGAGFRRSASQYGYDARLSLDWQVDETVVALTRAAMCRGIPLAVPVDTHFAPLVAYVASEYVSPEVAEGRSQRRFEGERGEGLRAVTFMSLGTGSSSASPRAAPKWADEFRELKVVSDEVPPLQSLMELARPLAAVGVGHGAKVNAVLSASASKQLPCWRLAPPPSNGRRLNFGEPFAPFIERKLAELRKELVLMPIEEGSRLRADVSGAGKGDAPPFFRAYPPLALYAQMLIERLANGS